MLLLCRLGLNGMKTSDIVRDDNGISVDVWDNQHGVCAGKREGAPKKKRTERHGDNDLKKAHEKEREAMVSRRCSQKFVKGLTGDRKGVGGMKKMAKEMERWVRRNNVSDGVEIRRLGGAFPCTNGQG